MYPFTRGGLGLCLDFPPALRPSKKIKPLTCLPFENNAHVELKQCKKGMLHQVIPLNDKILSHPKFQQDQSLPPWRLQPTVKKSVSLVGALVGMAIGAWLATVRDEARSTSPFSVMVLQNKIFDSVAGKRSCHHRDGGRCSTALSTHRWLHSPPIIRAQRETHSHRTWSPVVRSGIACCWPNQRGFRT